jgi:hypothetical protein
MKDMSSILPTPASDRGNPAVLAAEDASPPVRHAVHMALDRERLVALSAPAMEDLHRQLDSPTITVLLADSAGGVLRAIGSSDGEATARSRGLAPPDAMKGPGSDTLPPASAPVPTCGTAVPPSQLGIAVPILPPAGALLGFIDADAAPLEWLGHANALLHTAACIIEHRLIETEPQGFLLLRFHRYANVLGTPLEAMVLFDADGTVMLANQTARTLLAPCAFNRGGAAACFATQWCGIVGYAALGLRQPFVLRDRRGGGFSAQASLLRQTT